MTAKGIAFLGIIVTMTMDVFQPARAQEFFAGHNLTPTTYSLHQDQWTLGSYVVGYGINENWMVGTSPWLIVNYNMPMVNTRLSSPVEGFFDRVSLEGMYFKTFDYGFYNYQQESTFVRLTVLKEWSPDFKTNFSFGHQYYFDDRSPFSFRLFVGNGDRYTLSASSLSEIRIEENVFALVEAGFLGLNYVAPYYHVGLSLLYMMEWGSLQLGISRSMTSRPDLVPEIYYGGDIQIEDSNESSWHPELQLQFHI